MRIRSARAVAVPGALSMPQTEWPVATWTFPSAGTGPMSGRPSAVTARVFAARASEPTCAATTPTPANSRAEAVKVADSMIEFATPPPNAIVTSAETTPSSRAAMAASATATAGRASRPITPEATSSARPESSSARELRTTMKIAMSPAKNAPSAPARHALKPTAVVRSTGLPKIRAIAGLAVTLSCRICWASGSGNTQS